MSKLNPLGDLRAENDGRMLESAFYETPDFKSLLESSDKSLIVGRRGTGKSTIYLRFADRFNQMHNTSLITLAPEDYEVQVLRGFFKKYNKEYNIIKSFSKVLFQYALILEVSSKFIEYYKIREDKEFEILIKATSEFKKSGSDFFSRLINLFAQSFSKYQKDDVWLSKFVSDSDFKNLTEIFIKALAKNRNRVVLLIDRLDEGYIGDTNGIGLIAGIIEAINGLNIRSENFITYVFLRDNISRSIARLDPDYTRNFEGSILRLHWDEYDLFNMICNRVKSAFDIKYEKSIRIWDVFTAQDIKGKDGFRRCLRLTLYRPRDLIVLLNDACNKALRQDRKHIDNSDIETSAKEISSNRLQDLIKEYSTVFPGINKFIGTFSEGRSEYSYSNFFDILTDRLSLLKPIELQHYEIMGSIDEIVRQLYSIGFIGLKSEFGEKFIFCHDGKLPNVVFNDDSILLIHPCYWIALNIKDKALNPDETQEIYDEYSIEVSSLTREQRHRKIGQLMMQYLDIKEGIKDFALFEEWCAHVIRIIYAGDLSNVQLKSNKDATQRRDIIATNDAQSNVWKRIKEDYSVRQVIFEVKNYSKDLGRDEFRQMLSYLGKDYGNLGFIITRSKNIDVTAVSELNWIREIYYNHKKLIIKLNGDFLIRMLRKIRTPQKHPAIEKGLSGLLDRYARLYLAIGSTPSVKKRKSSKRVNT